MAILLSLLTSALFGTADFCGGLAAKRARLLEVVAGAHLIGLIGVAAAAPLVAQRFEGESALLGAAGGVFGGLGVALLYRRLALGPMSVVAPITALTSAAVPAAWGVTTGDALGAPAWTGVALAMAAIWLVSATGPGQTERGAVVTRAAVVESLLAGAGFGFMFVFFDATDATTAPWPIVAARAVTATALVGALASRSRLASGTLPDRGALALIALAGLFDTTSNVMFIYASDRGALTVVAVLSSLYPIATMVLARVVLAERMTRHQILGVVAALVATGLIAAG